MSTSAIPFTSRVLLVKSDSGDGSDKSLSEVIARTAVHVLKGPGSLRTNAFITHNRTDYLVSLLVEKGIVIIGDRICRMVRISYKDPGSCNIIDSTAFIGISGNTDDDVTVVPADKIGMVLSPAILN